MFKEAFMVTEKKWREIRIVKSMLGALCILFLFYGSQVFAAQSKKVHSSSVSKQKHVHVKSSKEVSNIYVNVTPPSDQQEGSFLGLLGGVKNALDHKNPRVIGYLQVDYAHYKSGPTRLGDGEELRRADIGVVGNVSPHWGYKLMVDFAKNVVKVKDAYLRYLNYFGCC